MTTRPRKTPLTAVAALAVVAACSGGDGHRTAPASLLPTAPSASTTPFVDPASARVGTMAVSLPSAEEALIFRQVLEAKLRAQGRPPQTTYVNAEGAIVWTLEYLRYRTNGCSQSEAIARVFAQIDRQGVPPVCAAVTGTPEFPPQNDSLAFRQALEAKYRDGLGAPPIQTFIDLPSDVLYTLEFVRYTQSGCSGAESYERVFAQIDGRGVQPDCRPQTPQACTFSLSPTPQNAPAGGGTFTATVTAEPAECRWQIAADVPWISGAARAALGTQGFTYSVSANESQQSRSGRITLRGDDDGRATLDVNQAASTTPPPAPPPPPTTPPPAPVCSYSVSPASISTDGFGGTSDIQVATGPGCAWKATSSDGFIEIRSGDSGVGSGTVKINVLRNLTNAPRTGEAIISWSTGSFEVRVGQTTGPPIAVIRAPSACDVFGRSCAFDGSESQGPITQWLWDFGDDGTGSGPTSGPKVDHDYNSGWFFDFEQQFVPVVVRLTVVGPTGSDSTTATVIIFSSDFLLMRDE